jgi:flavodoxin
MPKAVVLYYTRFGNTKQAAETISSGLRRGGIETECLDTKDAKLEDLTQYDAFIIGTPTHYGIAAKEILAFMDALTKIEFTNKKAAAFDTRYEDEKTGGLDTLEEYMKKLGMHLIVSGLPVLLPKGDAWGPLRDGELKKCLEFGEKIAEEISA